MNKKMGILPVNGTAKKESRKHSVNGLVVNGSGKRKAEESSDSEEDSKSKLVTRSTSKKVILTTESTPKKKKSSEVKIHKTISQTIITSVVATSPTQPQPQSPTALVTKLSPTSPDKSTLKPLESQSGGDTGLDRKDPQSRRPQQSPDTKEQQVSETTEIRTEKNRRKKEKKREREKLKKLAKKQSQKQ